MASTVYLLCAVTSLICSLLLIRSYVANRTPLLFWSSLSFVGLALNNILLFVDLVIVPTIDLSAYRTLCALASVLVLVFGLVWDRE
jgi:hypothetical protein